jgi:hypothetical protein
MDKVTLNHQQFCSFTGWSEKHALKQVAADRVKKLEKMGMQSVTMDGKGKKATFTFMIPSGFWRMSLIPSMSYSEWGADYLNSLIESRDIQNTDAGVLVRFSSEIYQELCEKHDAEYKAVEATCGRIRTYLAEHGYIKQGDSMDSKSHRVRDKKTGDWVTGKRALVYDQQARDLWRNFFQSKLSQYQLIKPDATTVPFKLIASELSVMYRFTMARWMDVGFYRVAKRTLPTDNMTADINYMRLIFLDTLDMDMVREEIARRQAHYKMVIAQRKEREQRRVEWEKAQEPTLEEIRELRKQIDEAAKNYRPRTDRTPEEQRAWDRMIEMAVSGVATYEEDAE